VGQDVTFLSSSFLLVKERQREHFPKEWRAETLDNSRCFPGAYRGRGPSGFVSCGCSCLGAKWTTVDLTLDPSSLSFSAAFLSFYLPLSALTLCLSCSIIPFTVSHLLSAALFVFLLVSQEGIHSKLADFEKCTFSKF